MFILWGQKKTLDLFKHTSVAIITENIEKWSNQSPL